jgi:hypothetical protein
MIFVLIIVIIVLLLLLSPLWEGAGLKEKNPQNPLTWEEWFCCAALVAFGPVMVFLWVINL